MYPVIKQEDLQPVLIHFLTGRSAMTNFIPEDKVTPQEAAKLWNSQVYITPATLCKFSASGAKYSQCAEKMPLLISEYMGNIEADFSDNDFTAFVIRRFHNSQIDVIEFIPGYHILESSWKHYQKLISAKYVQQ